MRVTASALRLSPSDLSAFLGCRHRTGLDLAVAAGHLTRPEWNDGAGLWWVSVDHDGNQNASLEEVDAVERIVNVLLGAVARTDLSGSAGRDQSKNVGQGFSPAWTDEHGVSHPITPTDLHIVAPYNAQVNRLLERLAGRGIPIGTVDKFQGQEAPVVIYSMATSRP